VDSSFPGHGLTRLETPERVNGRSTGSSSPWTAGRESAVRARRPVVPGGSRR